MDLAEVFSAVLDNYGLYDAVVTVAFFGGHIWLFKQYGGRLQDRQEQIDALAAENREYRTRFLTLLDNRLELGPGEDSETTDTEGGR